MKRRNFFTSLFGGVSAVAVAALAPAKAASIFAGFSVIKPGKIGVASARLLVPQRWNGKPYRLRKYWDPAGKSYDWMQFADGYGLTAEERQAAFADLSRNAEDPAGIRDNIGVVYRGR